ncbi:translation initiation factor IF-2 [Streptomyces zhihengii]
MRRLLLLAPLLPFVVGCGVVVQLPEERAADAAQDVAVEAGGKLYGQRPRSAAEVGRSAAGIDGVEVLRVTGTSTHDDGIEVIIRTSGSAYGDRLDSQKTVVRRCFVLRVSSGTERVGRPTASTARTALHWRSLRHPSLPSADRATPHAASPGAAERPRRGGRGTPGGRCPRHGSGCPHRDEGRRRTGRPSPVGRRKRLRSPELRPRPCGARSTDVWTPPRAQRMPGEGGCTVGNALDPLPAPH